MSGRGKSAANLYLIEVAQEIVAEIAPCTVRAVGYQLFGRKVIPDMSKNSMKRVSEQLTWARENDEIDWSDIVDESRSIEDNTGHRSAASSIRNAVRWYRRDNWQDQDCRLLVVSEKSTVGGTVRPVLEEYGVDFLVMHGFSSATQAHDLAEMTANSDVPLHLLYIGDFDPSGMYMSEVDLPTRLERYDGSLDTDIVRVALEADDLASLGKACFPASDKKGTDKKRGDSRYQWFIENHGDTCAELDALSPVVLRQRLRDAIEGYMDMDAWERAKEFEQAEIKSMEQFHGAWEASLNSKSGQDRK